MPLILLLVAALASSVPASASEYRYSDAHVHVVDFFQRGAGLPELLAEMDRHGVDHCMISGVGVAKKWAAHAPRKPRYYLGDDAPVYWFSGTDHLVARAFLALPEERRRRLHPFITGFNPTDLNAAEHIEQLLTLYPDTWQGIGEVFTRHDDLTALTLGETPRANHPAMDLIYQLAARHDLPVMIHSNLTSQREKAFIFLGEIKQALSEHPETRIIWAHAGTTKTINRRRPHQGLTDMLGDMLQAHPNLYIDLSWSVLRPYILDDEDIAEPEWVALIERFPDRFVLGSDVVGRFGSLGRLLAEFNPLLDQLTPETARLVARDNFLNLLPQPRSDQPGATSQGQ